ncbi:MAG: hypothetical protein HC848_07980 [Limnobacter sp.]|nr:hypothetical protein [Limnobacter sp.]
MLTEVGGIFVKIAFAHDADVVLARSLQGDTEEAFDLVSWSNTRSPATRKQVVRSFVQSKQSPFLIHQVARLKRKEATDCMKDYFSAGGDLKDIAEWLAAAGQILKTGAIPDDTDGFWGWVKKAASSVVDAVVGAINTVADAVKAAGKSLADAVSAVVSWTASKINDFVEAVLAAGKTVAQLLTEAVKKGAALLDKFVRGILAAGKKALDVINWAITQAAATLKNVLTTLEAALNSFTSLLLEVAKLATAQLKQVVSALLAAGKKVADFVERLSRLAYDTARSVVKILLEAGKSVADVIKAAIGKGRQLARIVLDGLLAAGKKIADALVALKNATVNAIADFIGALKDLGRALGSILVELVGLAQAVAIKMMQAIRKIWSATVDILQEAAARGIHVIKTVLVAILGTGIHLKNVLADIARDVREAFREGLIKGLLEIGKSALTLLKEAAKIAASVVAITFGLILSVLGSHRKLTSEERAEAAKVFGTSINLDMVRLTDANLASDLVMWLNKNRPFTTMYVINHGSGVKLKTDTLIQRNSPTSGRRSIQAGCT